MSNHKRFSTLVAAYFEPTSIPDRIAVGVESDVEKFLRDFDQLVFAEGQLGYPEHDPISDSSFENRLILLAKKAYGGSIKSLSRQPRIFLTHDIDYIHLTAQYVLKNILGRLRFNLPRNKEFLSSLRLMLEFDRSVGIKSLCFVPPAGDMKYRSMKSWLIDPSYSLHSLKGRELRAILKEYDCEVGLHGSILSSKNDNLKEELSLLDNWYGGKSSYIRQHWLHIPGPDFFKITGGLGLTNDFSFGWNGKIGFRGGLLREFCLSNESEDISAYPMTLMDGVIFDELGLGYKDFEQLSAIVGLVFESNGDLVLNWHGRAFSKAYNWGELYMELVKYALEKGFKPWRSV